LDVSALGAFLMIAGADPVVTARVMQKTDLKKVSFLLFHSIFHQKKLHGYFVIVWVDGQRRELAIFADRQLIKKLPIKGLQKPLDEIP